MILSFPKLVKDILTPLAENDYPVLNTRLFVKCWIGLALDKSLTSMRDLFQMILQVIEIPQQWGQKLIDKLRYLQACMCQEISYIHWMTKLTKC